MDEFIKFAPTAILIGFIIWIMIRSNRSYRVQEEARASQKEMMEPFFESVRLAKETAEIARAQLQVAQEILAEIKALRAEMRE